MRYSNCEMLFSADFTGADARGKVLARAFRAGSTGLKMFDAMSKMYGRYRINKLTLHWKTSTGTTAAGALILAVDGDSNPVSSVEAASSLYPKWRGPVWAEGNVQVNAGLLMPQRWLTAAETPFNVILSGTGMTVPTPGEVWCTYDVTFVFPQGN
jgi:hypothetical protein